MTPFDEVRTALFVPGDRPDRFHKAASSGADLVILDLEDAVPHDGKDAARDHVESWIASGHRAAIRINGTKTEAYRADVQMLRHTSPAAVVLPKAEPDDVAAFASDVRRALPVIVLVETAAGVLSARETCGMPQVIRAALGHLDLAADLGCDPESSAISTAADMLALASAAAGLAGPLDGVCTALGDHDILRQQCHRAKQRGYAGKLAVNPGQVPIIQDSFRPPASDVAWARRILASAGDGAAFRHDGSMVDEPVLRRARRIIGQSAAGANKSISGSGGSPSSPLATHRDEEAPCK